MPLATLPLEAPTAAEFELPEDWSIRPSTVAASEVVVASSALDGSDVSAASGALISESFDILTPFAATLAPELVPEVVLEAGPEFFLEDVSEPTLATSPRVR